MWYLKKNDAEELDYEKPIMAEGHEGNKLLLVPMLGNHGYTVIGYDWLNIETGEYNSCYHYRTAREAVESYKNYKIYNIIIKIKEIKKKKGF